MDSHHPPIRSLILLGGRSSRMGSPKHLLPIPPEISETGDDAPLLIHSLYLHHIFQVKHGDPLLRAVTLSVRDSAQCQEIKDLIAKYEYDLPADLNISYVQDSKESAGPSAGLVAAWELDSYAHWLVTSCDYPRSSRVALEELRKFHHKEKQAVTCFVDSEGCSQPLFAIWTGEALKKLEATMHEDPATRPESLLELLKKEKDHDETSNIFRQGVTQVHPSSNNWIVNVNTKEEWDQVMKTLKAEFG